MQTTTDDSRSQHVVACGRGCEQAHQKNHKNSNRETTCSCARNSQRQLAVISWPTSVRRRGGSKSSRRVECKDRPKHSVADTDSRPGAFESDSLGKANLCDH